MMNYIAGVTMRRLQEKSVMDDVIDEDSVMFGDSDDEIGF